MYYRLNIDVLVVIIVLQLIIVLSVDVHSDTDSDSDDNRDNWDNRGNRDNREKRAMVTWCLTRRVFTTKCTTSSVKKNALSRCLWPNRCFNSVTTHIWSTPFLRMNSILSTAPVEDPIGTTSMSICLYHRYIYMYYLYCIVVQIQYQHKRHFGWLQSDISGHFGHSCGDEE